MNRKKTIPDEQYVKTQEGRHDYQQAANALDPCKRSMDSSLDEQKNLVGEEKKSWNPLSWFKSKEKVSEHTKKANR